MEDKLQTNSLVIQFLKRALLFTCLALSLNSSFLQATTLQVEAELKPKLDVSVQLSDALQRLAIDYRLLMKHDNSLLGKYQALFSPIESLNHLATQIEQVIALHLLQVEQFNALEHSLQSANGAPTFLSRLEETREAYSTTVSPLVGLLKGLKHSSKRQKDGGVLRAKIDLVELTAFLREIERKQRLEFVEILRTSSLPNKSLYLPVISPIKVPSVQASFEKGVVADEVVASGISNSVPLEILDLAKQLKYDPIAIFDYVHSEIAAEFYYGSIYGAVGTLRSKKGNSTDQAVLLAHLLRASGLPALIVEGVISVPIRRMNNLVGAINAGGSLEVLQKSGIPFTPVFEGGVVSMVEVAHTWVSVQVPYDNYRGATIDKSGETWIPLMPFIKTYEIRTGNVQIIDTHDLVQQHYSKVESNGPLGELKQVAESIGVEDSSDVTTQSRRHSHELATKLLGYLPNSMPVKVVAVTFEGAELPERLIHRVKLISRSGNSEHDDVVLEHSFKLEDLISSGLTINYQAASQADHNLILSNGGLSRTPLFLVDVKPVVKVGGTVVAVGTQGVSAGRAHRIEIGLETPRGAFTVEKSVVAGSLHALAFVSKPSEIGSRGLAADSSTPSEILTELASHYLSSLVDDENELAAYAHRRVVRPVVDMVFVSNDYKINSLLDEPQSLEFKGLNIDVAFHVMESAPLSNHALSEFDFKELSSLQASYLEYHLFEDRYNVASISADKAIALAYQAGKNVLELDSSHINDLDQLLITHPDEVHEEILKWLQLDYQVRIPADVTEYFSWSGSTWVVTNAQTGDSGYFIAGGLAGGSTAEALTNLDDILGDLDDIGANPDPAAAAEILIFTDTSYQIGVAGEQFKPLRARVIDEQGIPVVGAPVTFSVESGAGQFILENGSTQFSITIFTDEVGIAEANYRSAESIADHAIVSFIAERLSIGESQRAGVSYISAKVLKGGSKPLEASDRYELYTVGGDPAQLVYAPELGAGLIGSLRNALGFETVYVQDRYGNPLSGIEVELESGDIRFSDSGTIVDSHRILPTDCEERFPSLDGSCGAATQTVTSNATGAVRVGIIFGDVQSSSQLPTIFPIKVVLSDDVSLEIPFAAQGYSRFSFSGPERPAVKAGESYKPKSYVYFSTQESVQPSLAYGLVPPLNVIGEADYAGTREVEVWNIPTSPNPLISTYWGVEWDVYRPQATDSASAVSTSPITGLEILFAPPKPLNLDDQAAVTKFPIFDLAVLPRSYIPTYISFEIYQDDLLFHSQLANEERVTLPPLTFDTNSTYQVQVVVNKGSLGSEVRSQKFDLPLSAPILRDPKDGSRIGGSGSIIIDDVNEASCVAEKPELVLELVQDAEVTIIARATKFRGERTFLNREQLDKGTHIFDSGDIGFSSTFVHEGVTIFDLVATSESDGRTERRVGQFQMNVQELNPLPIGSPIYEDINLFRGNLFISRNDVTVSGRGPNIEFSRSYSSRNTNSSSFGPGWGHNYDSFVQQGPCGWVTVSGGVAGGVTFFPQASGGYRPGKGYHSSLEFIDDGWSFYAKDGTHYRYQSIRRENNRVSSSYPKYFLDFVEDTNGNTTNLIYAVGQQTYPQIEFIRDSSGRQIELSYKPVTAIAGETIASESIDQDGDGQADESSFFGWQVYFPYQRNLISSISGLGYQIDYQYDRLGRLVSVINTDSEDPASSRQIKEEYQYGGFDLENPDLFWPYEKAAGIRITNNLDFRGIRTEYQYQPTQTQIQLNNVVGEFTRNQLLMTSKAKFAEQTSTVISSTFNYSEASSEPNGVLTEVVDPRNISYQYLMDRFGRNLETTGPTGIRRMTWPINDTLMLSSQDENGVLTQYEYDEHGNTIREEVSGALGGDFELRRIFDTRNNGRIKTLLTQQTDRRGNSTQLDYDERGNLTSIQYPLTDDCPNPCNESFSYFDNGDRSAATDRRGKRTSFLYDTYGNIRETKFPIGIKKAEFDVRSRKVKDIDELGNETTYEYDWLNRLVEQTNAEGGIRSFAYDANSNKIEEVDEEGRVTSHLYDFDNRVVESKTSFESDQVSQFYTYDSNDNLTSETDRRGHTTEHEYDDANRNILTRLPANQDGLSQTVSLEYDNAGNVVHQTIAGDPNQPIQETQFTYDNLYRQIEIMDAEQGITQQYFDGNDNLIKSVDELGRITEVDYDAHNQKITQRDAVGSVDQRESKWTYDKVGNVVEVTDPRGNTESFQYDDRNRQTVKLNRAGNRFIYAYDDYGNKTNEYDHFGNEIRYEFDSLHRPTKVVDQRGFITTKSYDRVGNPIEETWANGNIVSREYDYLNRKISEADLVGNLMIVRYDNNNNPIEEINGRGHVTNHFYDALNQKITTEQPEQRTLNFSYDVFGNLAHSEDGEGNRTTNSYDRLNRQITQTDAEGFFIRNVYDAVDNVISTTDKRGNTTFSEFDQLNRAVRVIEPTVGSHGSSIVNNYDANDNLTTTTDKRGIVSRTVYDSLDRVIEEHRDEVLLVRNTYSEIGDLIGLEDANGNKTAMQYNERHELIVQSKPEFAISRFEYDSMGNKISQVDEEGRVSRFTYDLRKRLLTQTNGASETTSFDYDLNNNQTRMTRPLGNSWEYSFDELDRLIEVTDALQESSTFGYDRENNLVQQVDAKGNATIYTYDKLNRRESKTYPTTDQGTATESYEYDANGNQTKRVDSNGQSILHTYDALNRLEKTEYANYLVSVGRDIQSESFTYDGNNNRIRVEERYQLNNGGSEIRVDTLQYDSFDRLFNRLDSFNKDVGYRFDRNGNRTRLIDSDGKVSSYTFDRLNRVTSATTEHGVTLYSYDRSSLLKEVKYPNNTTAEYDYDAALRIQRIHNIQNSATVSLYEYSFDTNGNRVSQRETNGGAEELTNYIYDSNDRLTEVTYNSGAPTELNVKYEYDAVYNRVREVHHDASQTISDDRVFSYNQRNQLLEVSNLIDGSQSATYLFDANGNQISKSKNGFQTQFKFDIRNDLREVVAANDSVGQFLYDHQGLRIEKVGERGVERSTYDDQSILQQYDVNNSTRAKFNYGADRLMSLSSTGEPAQFYLCDALQSVVNLTNDQGIVQARYQYDAWGNKRNQAGQSYNRFSFTGYEEDRETGLLYAKARFYDPDTGKFLSEDAWEGDQLIAPSLHRYLYAYQNPTVYVDPTGLFGVFADGTWQDKNRSNYDNDSNVARLLQLYSDGQVFYEPGIGTSAMTKFGKWHQGISGDGARDKIEKMYKNVVLAYNGLREEDGAIILMEPDHNIDLIGFSRGAALVRVLANVINERGIPLIRDGYIGTSYEERLIEHRIKFASETVKSPTIRSMLLFDTVGSFGLPGDADEGGLDLSIPKNVQNVRHAIASREGRKLFPLTSAMDLQNMNDPRIIERPFVGDHTDVGGGHDDDNSRSYDSLNWMWDKGHELGIALDELDPDEKYNPNRKVVPYKLKRARGQRILRIPQQGSRHIHGGNPQFTSENRNRKIIYLDNSGRNDGTGSSAIIKSAEEHLRALEKIDSKRN